MAKLNPYIRFNDEKCREAMNFYKDCFSGAELTFQTVGESPMAKEMPKETHGRIMHASFKKGDVEFMASDMMRDVAVVGDNIALSLNFDNEKELNTLFSKLAKGGEIFMPLEEQFWGAIFGVLTDKYGIEWMFNYQIESKK
jgi:PhnB protein